MGGKDGPEKGYENVKEIDDILNNKNTCNLSSTKPPVKAQDFLNAMMKSEERYDKASIATFIDLVRNR